MQKVNTSLKAIRHVAAPRSGTVFATAEFEHNVTIWSHEERRPLMELKTPLDFGGNRLALLSSHHAPVLVTASYKGGVRAYNGVSGEVLWLRNDLTNVQETCDLSNQGSPLVGIGCDDSPFEILDAGTGRTVFTLSRVQKTYGSFVSPFVLEILKHSIRLCPSARSESVWEITFKSFGILDAAIGLTQVVYSEVGGGLRCYDYGGKLCWELKSDVGKHVLSRRLE